MHVLLFAPPWNDGAAPQAHKFRAKTQIVVPTMTKTCDAKLAVAYEDGVEETRAPERAGKLLYQ